MSYTPTLDDLLTGYRMLEDKVMEEQNKRQEIYAKPEYKKWAGQKEVAELEMAELLGGIDDSRENRDAMKKTIMEFMRDHRITNHDSLEVKLKNSKGVNANALFHVLDDDIDMLLTVAKVSQADLKRFADGMPERKKEIMACIEDTGMVVADIEFTSPLSL